MQFPVPQFTDVEDKIIGPLTLKQFGIIFGVGVIVFLAFSVSKSILVTIFFFLLFGLPGLAIAFVPFNGRPVYAMLGNFVKFFGSTKELVFHKESKGISIAQVKDAKIKDSTAAVTIPTVQDSKNNLEKVQKLLRETATQEEDVAGKIK